MRSSITWLRCTSSSAQSRQSWIHGEHINRSRKGSIKSSNKGLQRTSGGIFRRRTTQDDNGSSNSNSGRSNNNSRSNTKLQQSDLRMMRIVCRHSQMGQEADPTLQQLS